MMIVADYENTRGGEIYLPRIHNTYKKQMTIIIVWK